VGGPVGGRPVDRVAPRSDRVTTTEGGGGGGPPPTNPHPTPTGNPPPPRPPPPPPPPPPPGGGGAPTPPHQLHHQTTYGLRTATVRLAWVDTLEDRRKIKDPAFATIRGGVVMRGAKGFCPLHTKNVTLATSYRQPAAAGRPTPHATSEGI
jgi:hypothetical protein